jgi:general secretion pathway protein G
MTRINKDSPGFTLVELLVVLALVTLLFGLLASSMVRARRTAGQLVCLSNLRQWGIATRIYSNENNGYLPRRGQGVGATSQVTRPTDWFNALPPVLQTPMYMDLVTANAIARPGRSSVWLCPEASDPGSQYYWSYAMNMGLSVWETSYNNGQPDKITGVGDPAVMVLLADAPGNYCSVFPSIYPNGYNPVPRHNNRVNICFLDGHAAAVNGAYIGCGTGLTEHPDVRWHPPGNTWNSAR